MIEFEKNISIQRSSQDVFDVITEPAKTPQWQSGVKSAEWITDAPVGVGSTFRTQARFLGRDIETDLKVTEWEPSKLVTIQSVSGPIQLEITNKVEPQGDVTLLSVTGRLEVGGFFKLGEGLVGKQVEKQVDNDMHTLKLLLESNQL